MWQCLTAAVLILLYSVPVSATRLLIPVGEVVGLRLSEGSVNVAAFHETCGAAAREAGIEIGDEIVSINGKTVDSAADLHEALKCSDGAVTVELRRGGKTRQVRLSPAVTPEGPRLGVYLRQGITGIGTVTFYDPQSGTFGALGHGVNTPEGKLLPMDAGSVYAAKVASVRKGKAGKPGQLVGAVTAADPRQLTSGELADIRRRVMDGEKIRF
jgi:stage IV sporulation protein B